MTIRAVGTIASHELRRVLRDPALVFFGLGLPALLMFLIGSTFYGNGSIDIGVLDLDRSVASAQMIERLDDLDGVDVVEYDRRATLGRDVRTSTRTAGLVIPSGFEDDASNGRARVSIVADPTSGGVAAALSVIDGAVAREGVRVAAADLVAAEVPTAERVVVRDRIDQLADGLRPVEVVDGSDADEQRQVGSFSYITPANLTLFVFINTFVVSTILANDRKLGITRRLLAAPVTAGAVTLGLAVAKTSFALVQAGVLVAVGTFVFRVHWGDPLAATSVVVLFALVAAGVGLIVGARVRDADQAQSIGIPIAVAAGMLGGCMWPLEIVPDAMRIAGHVTPHAWAMDVWRDLVFDDARFTDVLPELAVLATAAVVLFALAARSLDRAVVGGGSA